LSSGEAPVELEKSDTAHQRVPIWRDIRVLRVVFQVVAVGVVCYVLWRLFNNLVTNLDEKGISTKFDFLTQPTNFRINENPGFDPRSQVWEMYLVGIKNTFLASFVGIMIASFLGLIVGVSRLSNNWLVAKMAQVYVELFRNIPPLLVIIFFGAAVFTNGPFPLFREAHEISFFGTDENLFIISNTRWGIPSLATTGATGLFWILVGISVVAAIGAWIWRTSVNTRTGKAHHRVLWSLGTLIVLVAISYVATGRPYAVSYPSLSEDRRLVLGGFATSAGYLSVTVALGMYTASHIAEVIRGSILAVPKGQGEASTALALSSFQRYRFVVLPQALRIAIPPTINQYLNLVKNTSLGIAVAYADATALTKTLIGNGKPAPQSILVLMAIYLTFSLVISLILNLYNRRIQVGGR
jgi:general L-amino acid transport system permease protein